MIIEDADSSDLDGLIELEHVCSPHPWSDALMATALSGTEGERTIVGRAENETRPLLGFCVFRVVADEAEIHNVAVHPAHRRRGLARSLLVRALELAAADGALVAHLEVRSGNGAAIALYRQLGFEQVGQRVGYYTSPEEDAWLFSAAIQRPAGNR
jgi:[ribosomal protein S18]-alanine N-acetyltransferase